MNLIEKTFTNMQSLKIYSINLLAFLSTLTTLDELAKLLLVVVSVIYTFVKTLAIIKNDIRGSKKEENE